jgi:toxin ParE1/3/4
MPNIFKSPRAKRDLLEIWDYIADDSELRADTFLELIDQKLHILAQNSGIGRLRQELGKDLRSFPVGRYIIFYHALTNGIDIIRVLHSARELTTDFFS